MDLTYKTTGAGGQFKEIFEFTYLASDAGKIATP